MGDGFAEREGTIRWGTGAGNVLRLVVFAVALHGTPISKDSTSPRQRRRCAEHSWRYFHFGRDVRRSRGNLLRIIRLGCGFVARHLREFGGTLLRLVSATAAPGVAGTFSSGDDPGGTCSVSALVLFFVDSALPWRRFGFAGKASLGFASWRRRERRRECATCRVFPQTRLHLVAAA